MAKLPPLVEIVVLRTVFVVNIELCVVEAVNPETLVIVLGALDSLVEGVIVIEVLLVAFLDTFVDTAGFPEGVTFALDIGVIEDLEGGKKRLVCILRDEDIRCGLVSGLELTVGSIELRVI